MGEFWWGMSPKDEIRREGHFYPSCKGKCEPILKHMLVGLDVEPNPLEEDVHRQTALEILYEDEWLVVVHKPAGMLSVPGKNDLDSILQRLHNLYPKATGPLIVHRLDMATSGLLLAAKTPAAPPPPPAARPHEKKNCSSDARRCDGTWNACRMRGLR